MHRVHPEVAASPVFGGSGSLASSHVESWLVRHVFGILEPRAFHAVLALAVVAVLAWIRAPYTEIPDALFVSDGFGYYIYLPSIFLDHDLDLSNQVTRIPYEGQKRFFKVSEKTGRHTNQFPVGSAILWSPFFFAADVSARTLQVCGVRLERNGFGYVYELPVYLGSAGFGLMAIVLTLRNLKLMFPWHVALTSLFGVVFATPLAYYCWVEPNMSHTVAMFTITWWMWRLQLAYRSRDARWSTWIVMGLSLGLVALVRPYNGLLGLVAIPIALSVCGESHVDSTRMTRLLAALAKLVVCCLFAFVVLSIQMGVWKLLYGEWLVVPRGSGYERMRWLSPTMDSYLASVLVFSPLFGLGMLGLLLGGWFHPVGVRGSSGLDEPPLVPSKHPQVEVQFAQLVAPWMLVVVVFISLVIAASRDWYLGTAFGQRRLVDWSVFFAIGVALLISRLEDKGRTVRWAEWCVMGLAVLQCGLAVVYLVSPDLIPQYGRILG